jgi:hypothetical protein
MKLPTLREMTTGEHQEDSNQPSFPVASKASQQERGSSGNLVRDFGAEGELTAAEQNTVPVVFKVPKTSC